MKCPPAKSLRLAFPLILPLLLAPAPPRGPHPLQSSFGEADLNLIATLTSFTPDPPKPDPPDQNWREKEIASRAFRPAGTYAFTIIQTLSNDALPQKQITLHLPLLSQSEYIYPFDLPLNTPVMLLLTRDDLDRWVPVDFHRPLIPLSGDAVKKAAAENRPHPFHVLFDSLPDDHLRPLLMHMLQDLKYMEMSKVLAPYTDDQNLAALSRDEFDARCEALECLALNQDLAIIAKLPAFTAERLKREDSQVFFDPLRKFTDLHAVPLMIPLLPSEALGQNAKDAIYLLADDTSIPTLIAALDHDDPAHRTADACRQTLHHLLPALGPAKLSPDNRQQDIAALRDWFFLQPHPTPLILPPLTPQLPK